MEKPPRYRLATTLAVCLIALLGSAAGCDRDAPGEAAGTNAESRDGAPADTVRVYCFDTETDTLHICEVHREAPFGLPDSHPSRFRCDVFSHESDGPQLVDGMTRAAVEAAGAYIAYLRRLDPEADPDEPLLLNRAQLRRPGEEAWHGENTPEGIQIIQDAFQPGTDGSRPRTLMPSPPG